MFNLVTRNLYLCVGCRDDMATFLPQVLRGGVDIVQLREKDRDDEQRRRAAAVMVPICRDFGVPFVMNDSPELACAVGADGVHVGQDDAPVERCREILGENAIVGLSTHAPEEFDVALTQAATYFSAGPIVATPTKAGRAGTGIGYARDCEQRSDRPVFVTGGVDASNIASLVQAGLRRFVIVRYLTQSRDPEGAARQLRTTLDDELSAVAIEPTQ